MIFKEKDATTAQETEIRILESIVDLTEAERKILSKEAFAFDKGEWGEKQAAWYLNPEVRENKTRHLIHDLRIEVAGEWVQFDHVMWNKAGDFYLLETKNYPSIQIEDTGSCRVWYKRHAVECQAPHIQLRRQERLFQQFLKSEAMRTMIPSFVTFQYVLVPPTTRLNVSKEYRAGYSKMDVFLDLYRRNVARESMLESVLSLVRMARMDDSQRIADKLCSLHTPRPCNLRKQLGWSNRTALLDIIQPAILGAHDEYWDWFELTRAPSFELKRHLNAIGYKAMNRNGQWVWGRSY